MQSTANFEDREEWVTERLSEGGLPLTRRVRSPRRESAIAARIQEIKEVGGSLLGVALDSGLMTVDRVNAWLAGRRADGDTAKLSDWLDKVDADLAARTGEFIMAPNSRKILSAFEHARKPRDARGRRGVAFIFGSSGSSKTSTAEYAERMDKGVVYLLVDGELRTWSKAMTCIAKACGHHGHPEARESHSELVARLIPKGGLVIFDHAHLMQFRVWELLLSLPEAGIGVAFIGNLPKHSALVKQKLTQLTSRASGATVIIDAPDAEEVDAHLANLEISGFDERAFCMLIGCQDGGLRFLYDTVGKARELAAGIGQARIDVTLLKVAAAKIGCLGAS